MDQGYIKLYRKALDSGLIQHAKAWQFLSWCLLTAAYKPRKKLLNGVLFTLGPGQLVTSRSEACSTLRMTDKEFRAVQKLLENTGFLACEGTSAGTIITIINWSRYQQPMPGEGPAGGTAKGPATGQQGASPARARTKNMQEEKEGKNGREYSASASPDAVHSSCPSSTVPDAAYDSFPLSGLPGAMRAPCSFSDPPGRDHAPATEEVYITRKKRRLTGKRLQAFNSFWAAFAYPKGKAEAADAWLDIPLLTNNLVSSIIAAAEREAAARPGLVASGHTPKWAQGWIAGRRWEDGDCTVGEQGKNLDDLLREQGIEVEVRQ